MSYPEQLNLTHKLLADLHFLAELNEPVCIRRRDGDSIVITSRIFDETGTDVTEERSRAMFDAVFSDLDHELSIIESSSAAPQEITPQ